MNGYFLSVISALGLGILTSFHPCPFATNIAALSVICRWSNNARRTLIAGLFYSFGRILAYTCLGILISCGALSIPSVAEFLQYYMNKLLGPFLILVGMLVSGLIPIRDRHLFATVIGKEKLSGKSMWSVFFVGVIMAVSFCPASAGLFFGVLIPLAISRGSSIVLPAVYGVGTGLPLLVLAFLFSKGVTTVQSRIGQGNWGERWVPIATGTVLIIMGLYFILDHVYHLT